MHNFKHSSYWDKQTILSRIADPKKRIRYEAGSPNQAEVELYQSCLLTGSTPKAEVRNRILILGMTPEIRSMVLNNGFTIISIDHSKDAIDQYKNWIPVQHKSNEEIIHASWWEIENLIAEPLFAVMGDGVFGNILTVEKHTELLRILKSKLADDGIMVFRKALLPDKFDINAYDADLLTQKYRSGRLSDAEYGFSMRLWGNYEKSYDPESYILDNGITFQCYQNRMKGGRLSKAEFACICHYYFNGLNMILPQWLWEEILTLSGCTFQRHQLKGKDWYTYYPVYQCRF